MIIKTSVEYVEGENSFFVIVVNWVNKKGKRGPTQKGVEKDLTVACFNRFLTIFQDFFRELIHISF